MCDSEPVDIMKKRKIRDVTEKEMVTDDNSTSVVVMNSEGDKTLIRVRNKHIISDGDIIKGTVLESGGKEVSMKIENMLTWRHTKRDIARIRKSAY